MKKRILLMLPMCMFVLLAVCQNRVVTGTVTDEKGLPVEGATITIQRTKIGSTTDQFGNYRLANVAPNAMLVVSGAAIITKETSVGTSSVMNIAVQPNTKMETGYVIVGVPGAISKSLGANRVTVTTTNYQITNQSIIVTGIVTDDHGLPLSDVSVRIASTNASTGTDSLGQYRIYAASDTCTLIFETFGAWPMKENIKGRSIINIAVQYPDTPYGAFLQLFKQDEAVAYKP